MVGGCGGGALPLPVHARLGTRIANSHTILLDASCLSSHPPFHSASPPPAFKTQLSSKGTCYPTPRQHTFCAAEHPALPTPPQFRLMPPTFLPPNLNRPPHCQLSKPSSQVLQGTCNPTPRSHLSCGLTPSVASAHAAAASAGPWHSGMRAAKADSQAVMKAAQRGRGTPGRVRSAWVEQTQEPSSTQDACCKG